MDRNDGPGERTCPLAGLSRPGCERSVRDDPLRPGRTATESTHAGAGPTTDAWRVDDHVAAALVEVVERHRVRIGKKRGRWPTEARGIAQDVREPEFVEP